MKGLRVLDFTTALAGPFSSFLLRELGAEVIHVGRPHRAGAHSVTDELYLRQINFNKINVGIDLKSSDGRNLALRLCDGADVALNNFRPGVMDRLGLGSNVLRERNPKLIVAILTAAGSTSQDVQVGYAQIFAALAGLSDLTGYEDGPPVELRFPTDPVAGVATALSILVALASRKQSEVGAFVDVSARDAVLWTIGHEALAAQSPFPRRQRGTERNAQWSPNNVFRAMDGHWVALSIDSDAEWQSLCDSTGLGDEVKALGESKVDRVERRDAIEGEIAKWASGVPCADAVRILQSAGVAAFKVYATDDPWFDSHLRERGFWHLVPDMPSEVLGKPWRIGDAGSAPEPGMSGDEAREYVFGHILGLPDERIAELRSNSIID